MQRGKGGDIFARVGNFTTGVFCSDNGNLAMQHRWPHIGIRAMSAMPYQSWAWLKMWGQPLESRRYRFPFDNYLYFRFGAPVWLPPSCNQYSADVGQCYMFCHWRVGHGPKCECSLKFNLWL